MIVATDRCEIRSLNDNLTYWEQGIFPDWTALNAYRHFPLGAPGTGVEPHYHDNDEMWLFAAGRGEVWLDGQHYEITPNTMVYTPMGCVHRFQMFTPYENHAIVPRLERQKRPIHITVEEHGPPEPTVPGFVVSGADNTGPIADPGPRCPLSEWRMLALADGEGLAEETLAANEHWLVMSGAIELTLDDRSVRLAPEDIALLRVGIRRQLTACSDARVIVARERTIDVPRSDS